MNQIQEQYEKHYTEPEPEQIDKIVIDIDENSKESQTDEHIIIDIQDGNDEEQSSQNDFFKEEKEIKDFLDKIE